MTLKWFLGGFLPINSFSHGGIVVIPTTIPTSKPILPLDPLLWARPYNEINTRSSLDLQVISLYGLAQSNGSRHNVGLEVRFWWEWQEPTVAERVNCVSYVDLYRVPALHVFI